MNFIKATFNLATRQWSLDTSNLYGSSMAEIHISLEAQNMEMPLKSEVFLSLFRDNTLLLEKNYLQGRVGLISSDDSPLFVERQWMTADYAHRLFVRFKENEEVVESDFNFVPARPPQPYPSWVWEDGFWTPPVKKPINGPYEWNESTQTWTPLFEPNSIYANIPQYGNSQIDPETGKVVVGLNNENHKPSPFGSPGVTIALDRNNV